MSNVSSLSHRRVALYFIAFFSFIALVNAVMVTAAVKSFSGLVTDHPYEKGLAYNRVIQAEHEQQKLEWQGTLEYHDQRLSFTLRDAKGALLTPGRVRASIKRPTQSELDFSLELTKNDTPLTFPQKGVWDIHILAEYDGKRFRQTKRVIVE